MVLDIGGGTTDVAILSLGEIVTSTSLKVAGDRMDRDIIKYVKDSYKLLIGDRTAEEIKKRIGTAWKGSRSDTMDVSGRDLVTGLPHSITINSDETELAMRESLQDIVRACRTVLEQTPPELSADIITRGIVLTGGGALLHGMDQLLTNELNIPVYVAENALRCVVEGTGIMLENLHLANRR
jgi:rod shape-determining protein MreB and related proteins